MKHTIELKGVAFDFFRDLPGFPDYIVSRDGDIICTRLNKRIAFWKDQGGYMICHLRRPDGGRITKRVHVLVAAAWLGPRPAGLHVAHAPDPDKSNNRISNLSYKTPAQNAADALRDGTRGVTCRLFTPDDIREIRRLGETMSRVAIARLKGTTRRHVSRILSGGAWGWVN